ncbi:NAD(P)-dependent oxidoreductase [Candidatus Bathyarchaeota archaeon]|nr:MAG: NAD(P)-dependent oxidoreductase [Candidatus Bathyarchaeota archaeon]
MGKEMIGILHPGAMGVSIAASAKNTGYTVYWASEGRSPQTHERANQVNLFDMHSVAKLCDECSVIFSVCPPHAAEDVAKEVIGHGFRGVYLDANAISPQRAIRIDQAMSDAGVEFVDGGIIGGPAWRPGRTWLYLSGKEAQRVASCFSAGPLETAVIGDSAGKASALKMCYAAYTKGSTALLSAILAVAETLDVREELANQWSRGGSDFAEKTNRRVRGVTAKAWRFVGEMKEIASTFESAGMPGEFHAAAAEVYRRITGFKDAQEVPPLADVLKALLDSE